MHNLLHSLLSCKIFISIYLVLPARHFPPADRHCISTALQTPGNDEYILCGTDGGVGVSSMSGPSNLQIFLSAWLSCDCQQISQSPDLVLDLRIETVLL